MRKLFSIKLLGFLGASISNGGAGRSTWFSSPSLSSSSSPLVKLIRRGRVPSTAFLQPRQHRLFSMRCSNSGKGFLQLTDEQLLSQCEMDTFKASGPGGQHRNKRDSAFCLKHLPTGVIAQAVEDRSQHMNRVSALVRLRTLLALKELKASFSFVVG